MTDLRYPIGEFHLDGAITPERRTGWIGEIADLPVKFRHAVTGLTDAQLDTPYRPGGWTVRQVVHHVPDSHVNAYVRFKLALTEDNPTIKPYAEAKWAELPDSKSAPIGVSLVLLDAVHRRWVSLLRALAEADWKRTYFHPEQKQSLKLEAVLAMYAWHGHHHLAQVTALAERSGWR